MTTESRMIRIAREGIVNTVGMMKKWCLEMTSLLERKHFDDRPELTAQERVKVEEKIRWAHGKIAEAERRIAEWT